MWMTVTTSLQPLVINRTNRNTGYDIWMAEKLYYSAAPKILKILEEPPEKTLFLLVSEDPARSSVRSSRDV